MSPNPGRTVSIDLYTAILALATFAVVATTLFVVIKCLTDYGTIFKVASAIR